MRIFYSKHGINSAEAFSFMATDMHAHLLPGLDDGSPDIETSIHYIQTLHRFGLKNFICTPHIFGDMYRNDRQSVSDALDQLKSRIAAILPDVRISAAAEYMLDDYFMQLLHSGNRLLTIGDDFLLTEFPYTVVPGNISEMSFEIINAGYQPILAHPERYAYYYKNLRAYNRLKELGFLFQLNLLSITGYYGSRVAATAKLLVKEGLIDFVGTDLHHERHLSALTSNRSLRLFQKYFGGSALNTNLLEDAGIS